jgi:hypothetical protein
LAAKLEAVARGEIKRLVINIPPRYLKSLLGSVALPAWMLGRNPTAQIICVSYAQELSDKLARDCQAVMTAPFYLNTFAAGRYDDQVDSTAQALHWYRSRPPVPGILLYYQQLEVQSGHQV